MKSLIKKLLRENLLTEKLTNIDDDVNFLYVKYFEGDVNELEKTGIITPEMFQRGATNTDTLNTEESIKGNQLNSCIILVNGGSNFYRPSTNFISISVSSNALNYVNSAFGGNFKQAINGPHSVSLSREFSEERIKGSIHHELAHWLDDTFNNQHINKRTQKPAEAGTVNLGGVPVNSTKMEIQGQIYNVKQLHNKYANIWDSLTFSEMLKYSPPLNMVYQQLPDKFKTQWVRDLKTRMYREGLLGKNMSN